MCVKHNFPVFVVVILFFFHDFPDCHGDNVVVIAYAGIVLPLLIAAVQLKKYHDLCSYLHPTTMVMTTTMTIGVAVAAAAVLYSTLMLKKMANVFVALTTPCRVRNPLPNVLMCAVLF